jgi:hypothetical protein
MPTGVVVSMQDEKSQIKNREKAMRVLRARLQELEEQKQHDAQASERKQMVGSGDRSEKIRTYNFKENRVSDHRIGLTIHQLDLIMDGALDEIINALVTHYQAEKHKSLRLSLLAASLMCLALAARAQSPQWAERPGPVKNEELRRELLEMYKEDQAVREPFKEGRQLTEAELRAISERDEADTKRLKEILDKYGFPSVKLVGLDATRAFITMLLHSPSLSLQKRALPHVERAARRKEIPPDDFALLTDDVLDHEGKPQLYGTNFKFVEGRVALDTTQDPARLDERRRKLGLAPIREYARQLADFYKMPLDESSLPPQRK